MKRIFLLSLTTILILFSVGCFKVGNEFFIVAGAVIANSYDKAVELKSYRGKQYYITLSNTSDYTYVDTFGIKAMVDEEKNGICKITVSQNGHEGYIACDSLSKK